MNAHHAGFAGLIGKQTEMGKPQRQTGHTSNSETDVSELVSAVACPQMFSVKTGMTELEGRYQADVE